MREHYKTGAKVVHVLEDDLQPIITLLKKAKKTTHTLTRDLSIGDITAENDFSPPIKAGTTVGMMFIESPGDDQPLLFLTGGFSFEDMGIK